MKTTRLYFLILLLIPVLYADEFSLVQPISVERNQANIVKKVPHAPEKKVIQEIKKKVVFDDDKDGVENTKDRCPNTETDFIVDFEGCPKGKTLHIKYPYKQWDILQEYMKDIEEFSLFLKENKGYQVVIYGHTDNVGTIKSNKLLSQKRAYSVSNALHNNGIKSTRLTAIGKGQSNPIADNSTQEGREENRRIEILIIK